MPAVRRHIFLCCDQTKPKCSAKDASLAAWDFLKRRLDELGLTSRADALATELSAGERQRVAIARALVKDADIVLADEPTANLDSELGQRVVESLVAGVKFRNKVGIMVTHDLRMVALSDVILEMRDGHLLKSS